MNTSPKFCRFCALSKPNELFDLASSLPLFEDVKNKLKLLGINYVNLYEEGLPKAICHSCFLNLKNCYHVFERIKDSQIALRKLFLQNEGTIKKEIPNCDITQQGDFPFDFDCPRLKNVDESTRETVKTLALLPLYDARWHPHGAKTTQQLQNSGVQLQLQNRAPIAVQQPVKPNQPTQKAVERPLSPKSKTKRIKDSILKDWTESSKDGEDEVDKKDKNTGRTKRKHCMSLRYPPKDYLYYIPADRRRCMK